MTGYAREARPLRDSEKRTRFEQLVLPHLDAAYNLARWLTHDKHDAQDVVQEACLRAFQFFDGFRNSAGEDARPWLLAIVRNTCYTWMKSKRGHDSATTFSEAKHGRSSSALSPEDILLRSEDRRVLHQAISELPPEYREVIVLRELEELSYKEIADIAGVPLGTVMSRLARAREKLVHLLTRCLDKDT